MSHPAILQILLIEIKLFVKSVSLGNNLLEISGKEAQKACLERTSRTACLCGCASFAQVDPSGLSKVVVSCWCNFLNWGLLSRIAGSQGGIMIVGFCLVIWLE